MSTSINMREPLDLKSVPSVQKTGVCFVNCTLRTVDIYWVDFNGNIINYVTCKPKHVFNVDTFVGHPWVVFDTDSLDQLLLNKKYVFYPSVANAPNVPVCPQHRRRSVIYITLPVYTLGELSMHVLENRLQNVEDVATLELPLTLQTRVEELIRRKLMYSRGLKGHSCSELYDRNILFVDK